MVTISNQLIIFVSTPVRNPEYRMEGIICGPIMEAKTTVFASIEAKTGKTRAFRSAVNREGRWTTSGYAAGKSSGRKLRKAANRLQNL